MTRFLVSALVITAAAFTLALVGCTQPQAAPTPGKAAEPTKATPVPTKVAEPTKAQAVQPTSVPAKKVDYPARGRALTIIVPWAAGGGSDLSGRLAAAWLEKDLKTPVQVVNKVGAGSQVGMTEAAQSKPDGYTLVLTSIPSVIGPYLDPDRKPAFGRKDIQQIANLWWDPMAVGVATDSLFKTMKDLVDAAKAKPEQVKLGSSGVGTDSHMAAYLVEKATGVKFNIVYLESTAGQNQALAGGHVDVIVQPRTGYTALLKGGNARLLGVLDDKEDKMFPGVPTLASLGWKVYLAASRGICGPAGMPTEIADVLADSLRRYAASDEFKQKTEELALSERFMGPAEYSKYWDDVEAIAKPVIDGIRVK